MLRSLPTKGSVIAARTSGRSKVLHPARVLCTVPSSGAMIVKFLGKSKKARGLSLIQAKDEWFEACNVPTTRKHPRFDLIVACHPAHISALELIRTNRAKHPRKPTYTQPASSPSSISSIDLTVAKCSIDPTVAKCSIDPTVAKWPQKCTETGAMIVKGDHIIKTPPGWALDLSTPPASPPARRSLRLQASRKHGMLSI